MKRKVVLFALIMLFLLPALYSPENPSLSSASPSIGNESFVTAADGDESSESITSFSETTADDTIGVVDGDNLDTFRDVTDYSYSDDCSDTARWHSADDWDNFESSGGQLYMNFTGTVGNSIADRENNNIDITPFTPASYKMYTRFKWSSDDDTVTLVLGVWNETYQSDQDYWTLSGYSENTWHTITGSFVDLENATEIIIRGSGISNTKFMECWFEYIVIDSPLRVEDSSNVFSESFADVSDWTYNSPGGSDSISSDGDVMTMVNDWAGGLDTDYIYTNTPSGIYPYYEVRYRLNDSLVGTVNIATYSGDSLGGSNTMYQAMTKTTSWTTFKIYDADSIECIALILQTTATSGDAELIVDYLRAGPADEMGWQHDGSTTVGLDDDLYQMTVSSDGDNATFTTTVGAGRAKIYFDTTSTVSNIDPDYYPFLHLNVVEVTADWYLSVYFSDDSSSLLHNYASDTGDFRYNLKAVAGTKDIKCLYLLVNAATSYAKVEFFQLYSIANFTVTQSGATTDDYLYVDSGVLYSHIDDGYIEANLDPALSVTDTYPVYNLTTSGTAPEFSQYVSEWSTYSDDTRGATTSGTVTDIKLKFDSTEIISEIKFIEDGTAPTVVRSSSTPNDPEDDETITLSAVVTDAVEVYKVYFDAIVYPAGFSDSAYYATEQTDNLWTYSFTTLTSGYYCFKIQATDGANTNSLTEFAYIELTVREAAIIVEEITLIGAGEDFTMMTFSARINRDCTYTIYEESASSAEADTYTGSVTAPSFNIAWTKLDVEDSNVNFTIKFVSGTLSLNYTSQYQVAQTTFYVEYYNHDGPDWSEYVTVTGRITKTASYTVYIDDVEATTGTITNLDFDIEFSKILTSANREAWHDWAIKFTNGSQTCWANGTFYLWKNDPDQPPIGSGDLGGDERRTIQMWATIAAVIGVIGLGCIGLVYFKFDEVNKLQLPNYPTQPSTREERRRQRSQ